MKKIFKTTITSLTCLALSGFSLSATAKSDVANYPDKPVRFIVPFAAGGATDTLARLIGEKLGAEWKGSVVVENKTGASGNVGTTQVARADPDGYTMLMTINSFSINQSLYKQLPYDPVKDFAPLILVATSPNVLVVNPQVPATAVKELIQLAKSEPGKLSYASSGTGSGAHLAGELFIKMADVDLIHVPYKGASATMADLVGGRVTMSFIALPVALPYINSGQLRVFGYHDKRAFRRLSPDFTTHR